jgi:calcium-dependent protein kinase
MAGQKKEKFGQRQATFDSGAIAGKVHVSQRNLLDTEEDSNSCGCCAGLFALAMVSSYKVAGAIYPAKHTRRSLASLPSREGWNVEESYDVDPNVLGEGAFGVVKRVVRKRSGKERVMKCMNKDAIEDMNAFINEVSIQADMDHPHIVRIFDFFQDNHTITLILEICRGGDCSTYLEEYDHFSELDTSIVFSQIVRAVGYMHGQNIVHRDLKPENFLLKYKDVPVAENLLKVIDFGFAKPFEPGQSGLKSICGSPWYMAPELWDQNYDQTCDIWSLGVILFLFLSGDLPFGTFDAENEVVFAAAKQGKIDFSGVIWKELSPLSKLLCAQMCKLEASSRPRADEVLGSLWMKQEEKLVKCKSPKRRNTTEEEDATDVVTHMKSFSTLNAFNKSALYLVAHSLPEGKIAELREIFEELDTNGDGVLDFAEVGQAAEKIGLCKKDVDELFQDMDNSGSIEYTEFLAMMAANKARDFKDACWEAFRVLDSDGDRCLSMDDLKTALKNEMFSDKVRDCDIEDILKKADEDGNGYIDFEEFCKLLDDVPQLCLA